MITLHQFARVWDIPNLSPFCCKVETYLRMAAVPYRVADAIPPRAPKGKLPYITDDGRTIADSRFIIEYLRDRYHADLDQGLTPTERAESMAFQRMIEDDLHWSMLWSRWAQAQNWQANKQAIFGGFPPVLRDVIAWITRRQIRKEIWGHGLGRNTEDEIFHLGKQDLTALSDFLADKPFFMGERPTTLDASAFGLLSNVLWCPVESPLKAHAQTLGNLVAFCERVRDRYFEKDAGAAVGM
jgi:glutathione S-transferase